MNTENTSFEEDLADISACQSGDLTAFAGVFDRYQNKIYSFILYRTGHKQTAEDITTTVFMKALEHVNKFDAKKGTFSAWLYRIARNTVIDHYRTSKSSEDISLAWDVASTENIEKATDARNKLKEVKEYLKVLSPVQRDVVLMRVWDNMSHREISEVLGISEASSKTNFSRALGKINKEVIFALAFLITYLNN